jgi:hypothetical protein
VTPTPERSASYHVGEDQPPWLEQTLDEIPGLPDWSMTVVVGSEGTVERLVIEPRHVKDDSPRRLVCIHCGHDGPEIDSRGTLRRTSRRVPRTKPGPTPAGGITTRMLRRIPLGDIAAGVRASGNQALGISQSAAQRALPEDSTTLGWIADALESRLTKVPRPGRRGRGDQDYALVAYLYVKALDSEPTHPVKEVAEQLDLTPSRVRDMLYEARTRELLERPSGQGVPGGRLTAKGLELLRDGQS